MTSLGHGLDSVEDKPATNIKPGIDSFDLPAPQMAPEGKALITGSSFKAANKFNSTAICVQHDEQEEIDLYKKAGFRSIAVLKNLNQKISRDHNTDIKRQNNALKKLTGRILLKKQEFQSKIFQRKNFNNKE